jgi:hypothetical protein
VPGKSSRPNHHGTRPAHHSPLNPRSPVKPKPQSLLGQLATTSAGQYEPHHTPTERSALCQIMPAPLQMPCQTLSTSKSASGRSTHPETPLHVSCILHAYATCNVTQRTRMNPENLTTHHDHISKLSLNMNELTHRLFYHHGDCR